MTLNEMAREYRANTNALELRILLLQTAQRRTRQREIRYRLKRRIGLLRVLVNENRKTVFLLEHYHDQGGMPYENRHAV